MASRHENPGRVPNDNFLKTLYKISTLFQIFPEIINGAAQSLTAYGWYSSKDASQHVCIYETGKNRVHILPLISKLISVDSSWKYPKNTLDAAFLACFWVKNLISFWAFVRKFRHFYFLSHIDWHQNNFHSAWTREHEDHIRYVHPSDSGHWQICCRDARGNMTIAKK